MIWVLLQDMITKQNVEVDAISGATCSSVLVLHYNNKFRIEELSLLNSTISSYLLILKVSEFSYPSSLSPFLINRKNKYEPLFYCIFFIQISPKFYHFPNYNNSNIFIDKITHYFLFSGSANIFDIFFSFLSEKYPYSNVS